MAKILDLTTMPDPKLRLKSKEIGSGDLEKDWFPVLCEDMELTMAKKDGVGLAAPQIGKNIRLIVINTKNGCLHMVNPRITKKSLLKEIGEEGCLSVPGTFGDVKRHKKVTCRYLDKEGIERMIEAQGFMARVLQHEIDHLDGILFIDKAKNIRKNP